MNASGLLHYCGFRTESIHLSRQVHCYVCHKLLQTGLRGHPTESDQHNSRRVGIRKRAGEVDDERDVSCLLVGSCEISYSGGPLAPGLGNDHITIACKIVAEVSVLSGWCRAARRIDHHRIASCSLRSILKSPCMRSKCGLYARNDVDGLLQSKGECDARRPDYRFVSLGCTLPADVRIASSFVPCSS